jgi:hypothetical protein
MNAVEMYRHPATIPVSYSREGAGFGIVCLWSLTGLTLSILAALSGYSDIGIVLAAAL